MSFDLGFGIDDQVHVAAGQDIESGVTAAFGPFVGLLRPGPRNQRDSGGVVGEI